MSLTFEITGILPRWIESYLHDRAQLVQLNDDSNRPRRVSCGIPQGSVLRSIMFALYTADLGRTIKSFTLLHHCYADDTQVYGFCRSDDRLLLKTRLLDCINAIARWMASNRLNPAKCEFMWCATSRQHHHVDDFVFDLPDGSVATSKSVRNLGAYLDQAMTFHEHVARLVSTCFYQPRPIRFIRRSIPTSTAIQLVNSSIISRVDYCNSLLSGAPACLTNCVQSILNAAACLIYGREWYDHVTDLI